MQGAGISYFLAEWGRKGGRGLVFLVVFHAFNGIWEMGMRESTQGENNSVLALSRGSGLFRTGWGKSGFRIDGLDGERKGIHMSLFT